MNNFADIFADYMNTYKNTSGYKDKLKLDIWLRKSDYEERLDEMYTNCIHGTIRQIIDYNNQIDEIKSAGLKVLRNSSGKHKIVIK